MVQWSSVTAWQTQAIHVLTLMYNRRDIYRVGNCGRWQYLSRGSQPLFFNFGLYFLNARSCRLALSILVFQLIVENVFLTPRIVPSRIRTLHSPLCDQAIPDRLIIST